MDEYQGKHEADISDEESPLVGDAPPQANVLFSNRSYDIVKFCALILFPAVGTLYFALAAIWGLPAADQVVGTIVAIDAFLGVVLGISSKQYDSSDAKYDGELDVVDNGDGTGLINLQPTTHPADFSQKKQVTFKVNPGG